MFCQSFLLFSCKFVILNIAFLLFYISIWNGKPISFNSERFKNRLFSLVVRFPDKYQDIAYNPLGTVNDNKCNGDICDFVVNARVTYCESKQCPKGDDIIEKNGKCYTLECPAGTYLSGEKCIKVN